MYVSVIFDIFFSCSLAFLDEHAKEMLNKKGGQWSPLITYRNGLAGQDEEEEGMEKERDTSQQARKERKIYRSCSETLWMRG